MDQAAKVQKRKDLLIAAGINEHDAKIVAAELQEGLAAGENGGINGQTMANGQGRRSQEADPSGMYGTGFKSSKEDVSRPRTGSDSTYVQRPQAVTTGRYSYLGRAGRQPSQIATNDGAGARLESPAMATNEEIYAPLKSDGIMQLGGLTQEEDPRYRFSRTISSGV